MGLPVFVSLHDLRLALTATVAQANVPVGEVDFLRDVRPILTRNCFPCHGPDDGTRATEFRVDQRDSLRAELEGGGVAIVPRRPDQSVLFQRLTADADSRMPPADSGHTLTPVQIELIRRWIELGAAYDGHWSFEPIQRPQLPSVAQTSWPRNEIDLFVLSRLEQQGIDPSPEAERETLIRRLSLDLIGLPPAPQEVADYLHDRSDDAYERIVDRLLESPHFGERWGRHWLDLARYADSDGYLGDDLRPDAYRYRDWVIDAVNRDVPFDEFTMLQLAGDLIGDATLSDQTATGFHRNAMKNTEAGADRELDRVNRTVDRVSTVGSVWLGLTVGCAECHSHKYDPISQREFYELFAFFNEMDHVDIPAPAPAAVAAHSEELERWSAEVADVKAHIESLTAGNSGEMSYAAIVELFEPSSPDVDRKSNKDDVEALLDQATGEVKASLEAYAELLTKKPDPPESAVLAVCTTGKPRATPSAHSRRLSSAGRASRAGNAERFSLSCRHEPVARSPGSGPMACRS